MVLTIDASKSMSDKRLSSCKNIKTLHSFDYACVLAQTILTYCRLKLVLLNLFTFFQLQTLLM